MFTVSGPPTKHSLLIDSMRNVLRQVFGVAGEVGVLGHRVGEPFPIHLSVQLVGKLFDLSTKIFRGRQGAQKHGSGGSIAELDIVGIPPPALAGFRIDEVVPKSIDTLQFFERFKRYGNSLFAFFSGNPTSFHPDYDSGEVEALFFNGQWAIDFQSDVIAVGHSVGRALGIGVPFLPEEIEAATQFPFHERA